mmetsp:Transcript_29429/g.52685  ORF Transcript_29429/g.52685 Transcript_29429/m.52685 type:complete len:146 (+) Transcript_29429:124-561(+)
MQDQQHFDFNFLLMQVPKPKQIDPDKVLTLLSGGLAVYVFSSVTKANSDCSISLIFPKYFRASKNLPPLVFGYCTAAYAFASQVHFQKKSTAERRYFELSSRMKEEFFEMLLPDEALAKIEANIEANWRNPEVVFEVAGFERAPK